MARNVFPRPSTNSRSTPFTKLGQDLQARMLDGPACNGETPPSRVLPQKPNFNCTRASYGRKPRKSKTLGGDSGKRHWTSPIEVLKHPINYIHRMGSMTGSVQAGGKRSSETMNSSEIQLSFCGSSLNFHSSYCPKTLKTTKRLPTKGG